jgi:hypothetical protein
MSIFEKIFGGGEIKEELVNDKTSENTSVEKEAWNLRENARLFNIFIAGRCVQIPPEFVEVVIKEAGLTEQEVEDMQITANGGMLNNGLSVSANMAYMDDIRRKLVRVIEKMDVGEV